MRFLLTLSLCVRGCRGELARLYAVVGGVDLPTISWTTGYKQKTPIGYVARLGPARRGGLFPNCTFAFGCLQESLAVERYIRSLSPKFTALTPQELAIDDMFAMVKEDLIHVEPGAANASVAKSIVTPLYDRYLSVLENDGYIPSTGFVNGKRSRRARTLRSRIHQVGLPVCKRRSRMQSMICRASRRLWRWPILYGVLADGGQVFEGQQDLYAVLSGVLR